MADTKREDHIYRLGISRDRRCGQTPLRAMLLT